MSVSVIIILFVVLVPVAALAIMYNTLISRKNQADNALACIDVQLKKRYDLIPGLIAAVQKYMQHEKSTLTELTELRAQASRPELPADEKVLLNNRLQKSIRGIMLVAENYPELKASENMMQMQRALNEVEEQLSASRRAYNAAVTEFNNAVEMFPTCCMAGMMRLQRRAMFEIPEEERANIDVKKLFNS